MNIWLKRLAVASILGFPIAVVGTRFNVFDFKLGMLIVAASLLLALIIFLVGGFLSIKQKGSYPASAKNAFVAMLISLVPLIGIGSVLVGARDVPKIHNISTDVMDPPSFIKIAEIRTDEHNPLAYKVDDLAELQLAAYPDVKTLTVNMSREAAIDRALLVIEELGWELVDENREMSILEASETTALWGFIDDIVIRFRSNQTDDQITIDLRSVSRVGQSDLGANAKRIESFIATF